MAKERTCSIIKPDAVAKNVIGEIYSRFEKAGLQIVAAKMLHLTKEQAEGFYAVHKDRPFYNDLVTFMTSGPVVVQVFPGTRPGGGPWWRRPLAANPPCRPAVAVRPAITRALPP